MGRKGKDETGQGKDNQDTSREPHSLPTSPVTTRRSSGTAPGKTTLVEKRYGRLPARRPDQDDQAETQPKAGAENAYMNVEAFESPQAREAMASWQGKTFYFADQSETESGRPKGQQSGNEATRSDKRELMDEPRARFTAHRHGGQWQWSHPDGALLKINSDASGDIGQLVTEWAPSGAAYMEVTIEPLEPSRGTPEADDVLYGYGPINMDPERITLEDVERIAAELEPSTRAGGLPFLDSPVEDSEAGESATGADTQGGKGTSGQGDQGSGTASRGSGRGTSSRAGKRKELTAEHGSERPSWYAIEGAEIAEEGGRTPTKDGRQGGSAGGRQGQTGHILGSGWLDVVDAPEDVAPLVNAGIILADANIAGFGQGLFRKVVKGMAREAIEREVEREARAVIRRSLKKEARRLRKTSSFRALSKTEQQRVLKGIETDMERAYYEHLEKFAHAQAAQQDAIAASHIGADDALSVHEHKLATENAAAYREIEAVAAQKTGGTVKTRPDDAVAARPYDPHTTRAELETEYPGQVSSSTVPPTSQPNVKRRGQRHPKTGVVYDQRGLPIYDDVAVFETKIPAEAVEVKNRVPHLRAATKELDEAIRGGKVDTSIFTEEQLAVIRKHEPQIPGFTSRWPREVSLPGLLQTRTCGFPASGSSDHGFATRGFQL